MGMIPLRSDDDGSDDGDDGGDDIDDDDKDVISHDSVFVWATFYERYKT